MFAVISPADALAVVLAIFAFGVASDAPSSSSSKRFIVVKCNSFACGESARDRSAALSETSGESLGETSVENLFLLRGDVVRHAIKRNALFVRIVKSKPGARIAITRLPDRAGIDQVAIIRLKIKMKALRRICHLVARTHSFRLLTIQGKGALHMGMAEKGKSRLPQ